MKFTDVKTLEHLLKEYKIKEQYPIPSGEQGHGTKAKQNKTSTANKLSFSPTTTNAPKPTGSRGKASNYTWRHARTKEGN